MEITCYTIDYEANGGVDGAVVSEKVVEGKTAKLSGNTVKSGYQLNGWNSRADGGGVDYSKSLKITDNLTLYDQWKPSCR